MAVSSATQYNDSFFGHINEGISPPFNAHNMVGVSDEKWKRVVYAFDVVLSKIAADKAISTDTDKHGNHNFSAKIQTEDLSPHPHPIETQFPCQ